MKDTEFMTKWTKKQKFRGAKVINNRIKCLVRNIKEDNKENILYILSKVKLVKVSNICEVNYYYYNPNHHKIFIDSKCLGIYPSVSVKEEETTRKITYTSSFNKDKVYYSKIVGKDYKTYFRIMPNRAVLKVGDDTTYCIKLNEGPIVRFNVLVDTPFSGENDTIPEEEVKYKTLTIDIHKIRSLRTEYVVNHSYIQLLQFNLTSKIVDKMCKSMEEHLNRLNLIDFLV